jgi:pyruvate kinase
VTTATGRGAAAIGAGDTAKADGSGIGVAGCAAGAAVGCGAREGAALGAALGFGLGAADGGTLMLTAVTFSGTDVGTAAAIGAELAASCGACVGAGTGGNELSGAGVGFGGAVGANFESSCSTRGCGGAAWGRAAARACGTTGACGTGGCAGTVCWAAGRCGASRVTVTIAPFANDSVCACSDEDVGSENNSNAASACKSSDAAKLTIVRSGRRLSMRSRAKRRTIRGLSRNGLERMEKFQKRTKIVATLGPASRAPETIRSLVVEGANVFRLNFSHGSLQEHGENIERIRTVAAEMQRHIAILQDLPGPKVRTGRFSDGVSSVRLERGNPFVLTTHEVSGDGEHVSVSYKDLPADVAVGNRIYLQDGAITLRITEKSATDIQTVVEVGGDLREQQGINYPDGTLNIAAVSDRDLEFLAFGLEHDVDYVAVSFVRSADDVRRVKAFISERGKSARVLAKIEKHEALDEIDQIIEVADGIMVARGDLGIEIPLEQVPLVQKDLIARCNRASKPVVTATQMLESMTFNPRPTRAEATDVANAILDGTDAVMLSGETARGQYPTETVRVMAEIAREVEKEYPHEVLQLRRLEGATRDIATSIAEAATRSSAELNLPYIVTGTTTGSAAHHISAFRPKARVVALTPLAEVARRLALLWGIESILIERYSSIDVLLHITEQRMVAEGLVTHGDCVAFTTGMPVGAGGTNLLKVHQIP